MYGLLVWAVVFAMLLWLMASGVRAGFNAMVGVATAGCGGRRDGPEHDPGGLGGGGPAGRVHPAADRRREAAGKDAPAEARQAAEDPATRQRAEEAARQAGEVATRVTWYTFLGDAGLDAGRGRGGGYVGAGPTFRLFAASALPAGRNGYERREAVAHR